MKASIVHEDQYRNLPHPFKSILSILALHVTPMLQREVLSCLAELSLRDRQGVPYQVKNFRLDIKEMEQKRLIVKDIKGLRCSEPFRRLALFDLKGEIDLEPMAMALAKHCPFESMDNFFIFVDVKAYRRAIHMAVFSHEAWADIRRIQADAQVTLRINALTVHPFLDLFNDPYDRNFLDTLPVKTRIHTLEAMINEAVVILDPGHDALDDLSALVSTYHAEIDAGLFLKAMMLTGRIGELSALSQVRALSHSPAWIAALASAKLLVNDKAGAFDDFMRVLSSRQKGMLFQDERDLFFLLALLCHRHDDKNVVLRKIQAQLKHISHIYMVPISVLISLIDEIENGTSGQLDKIDLFPMGGGLGRWITLLLMCWINKPKAKTYVDLLDGLKNKAAKGGYIWLEAESCSLLAQLGKQARANAKQAKALHQEMGTVSLIDFYTPLLDWEKKLVSLARIGGNIKTGRLQNGQIQNVTGKRLIWLLSYNDKYGRFSVAPRFQTLNKNGKWTRGRPVSLKKLYDNHDTMEYLIEQDHRVCGAINEYTYRRGGYYNYTNVEYVINEDKALPELFGHPFLFLDDDNLTPVELVEGEPELRVANTGSSIVITLEPMPRYEDSRTGLVREGPGRFKVVRFSTTHIKIAEILGEKGLNVPQKGKERASDVAGILSSHITIRTDMDIAENEDVREIPADSTPHVHVMPHLNGIALEMFVRPIRDLESYVKPGRGGRQILVDIKGEKVKTIRELTRENERVREVVRRCPTLEWAEETDEKWEIPSTEEALELLFELKACGDDIVLKWPQGETLKVRSQVSSDAFKLVVAKDRDWFSASGELRIDEHMTMDLHQLMALLDHSTGRFVTLKDGTFLSITRAFKKRLEELKAFSIPHKKKLRLHPLSALALEDFTKEIGSFKSDRAWKAHVNTLNTQVNPEVPGTLQARLREYQVAGFKWLAQMQHWQVGACLADDMGLGKTVQALATILLTASKGPTLVVAPLSVMNNWVEECRRFAPTLHPRLFGQGDRKAFLDSLGPFDLVISSYGLLQVEREKLSEVSWQTVVLDEAQAIKNVVSKRSKAAMNLNACFRLATTGTPVENHLSELWTLFRFLNPGLLGSWAHFKNTFALPVERDQDKDAARRLKKLIRPFILRRIKSDVLLDLPEKTEIDLDVIMSDEEALLYEAQRRLSLEAIEDARETSGHERIRILAELTRLRQLCCHPSLILPDIPLEGSKLKVFGDLVDELLAGNHKALVFSQFVKHLSVLRRYLDTAGIAYQYLDGSTPASERLKQIDGFQNGEGDLFLISLKAGGFGLNLTAADYVIHMDPWWNPAVEDQASDRAHRIGQTRPVTVYRLIMKDTIEENIIRLHKEKRDLADSLLAGGDVSATISTEELLDLLKANIDGGEPPVNGKVNPS